MNGIDSRPFCSIPSFSISLIVIKRGLGKRELVEVTQSDDLQSISAVPLRRITGTSKITHLELVIFVVISKRLPARPHTFDFVL
jgi:hypothetical protein